MLIFISESVSQGSQLTRASLLVEYIFPLSKPFTKEALLSNILRATSEVV